MPAITLPPVTDEHRRAAFFSLRLVRRTYAEALQDPILSRIVEARAHTLRTKEFEASHQRTVVPVKRCQPGLDGHPLRWCTQMAPGAYDPHQTTFAPTNPQDT